MGKKYLDTKEGSLEQSVLGVWQTAIEGSVGSEKIKNADEVFVMANTANDAERVRNMNDLTGTMRIKERAGTIKNSDGIVQQLELKDEKRKMQRESNRQFKDKFGG